MPAAPLATFRRALGAVRSLCPAERFDGDRLALRDRALIAEVLPAIRLLNRRYLRLEAPGLEHIQRRPALYVANHNGGIAGPDLACTLETLWDALGPLPQPRSGGAGDAHRLRARRARGGRAHHPHRRAGHPPQCLHLFRGRSAGAPAAAQALGPPRVLSAGADAPRRVRRLVLDSTARRGLEISKSGMERALSMAQCMLRPTAADVEVCLLRRVLSAAFRREHPGEVPRLEAVVRAEPASRAGIPIARPICVVASVLR